MNDSALDTNAICITCGVQFAPAPPPLAPCPICSDQRQYVGWDGQIWTTMEEVRKAHHNVLRDDLGILGIGTEPRFAIGQRALLIQSPSGNVLWDCVTLIDDNTVKSITALGGVRAIAISHPHYYSAVAEWSRAFDAEIILHNSDRQWMMHRGVAVQYWSGDTKNLWDGITLVRAGGHFDGGTVLHWPEGADGKGALLAGDILQVVQDRRWVSFMYSYPNLIPLSAAEVDRVVLAVAPFEFERIYGAWWDRNVIKDGKVAVRRSAERYKRALRGRLRSHSGNGESIGAEELSR